MIGCIVLAFALCQPGYAAPVAYPQPYYPQQYYAPQYYAPPVAYAYPSYGYGYGYPIGVNLNIGGRGGHHAHFRRCC